MTGRPFDEQDNQSELDLAQLQEQVAQTEADINTLNLTSHSEDPLLNLLGEARTLFEQDIPAAPDVSVLLPELDWDAPTTVFESQAHSAQQASPTEFIPVVSSLDAGQDDSSKTSDDKVVPLKKPRERSGDRIAGIAATFVALAGVGLYAFSPQGIKESNSDISALTEQFMAGFPWSNSDSSSNKTSSPTSSKSSPSEDSSSETPVTESETPQETSTDEPTSSEEQPTSSSESTSSSSKTEDTTSSSPHPTPGVTSENPSPRIPVPTVGVNEFGETPAEQERCDALMNSDPSELSEEEQGTLQACTDRRS